MPNELEQELLELARLQRVADATEPPPHDSHQQGSGSPMPRSTDQPLPELDPSMLLSAAGQAEMAAAQAQAGGSYLGDLAEREMALPDLTANANARIYGGSHVSTREATEAEARAQDLRVQDIQVFNREAAEEARALHRDRGNDLYHQEFMAEFRQPNPIFTDNDLADLFMNQEAQDAVAAGVPVHDPIDIRNEPLPPIVSETIRASRDRLSPNLSTNYSWHSGRARPMSFDQSRSGAPDQSVVSARMPDGTWAPRPLPSPGPSPQRHRGMSMGSRAATPPEPAQAPPSGPRPNRYALLSGSGLIDD